MDRLSPQQRHDCMASIRSKDTKPELIVRKGLWGRGFRYRLNDKRLPGHPDLVLRKYRTCIFINGCFWHGHNVTESQVKSEEFLHALAARRAFNARKRVKNGDLVDSACCKIPKTNREFWVNKIRRNKERDKEEQRRLAEMGWHSIVVWECELKPQKREGTLDSIAFTLNHIWLKDHHAKVIPYQTMEEEDMQIPMAAESEPVRNSATSATSATKEKKRREI